MIRERSASCFASVGPCRPLLWNDSGDCLGSVEAILADADAASAYAAVILVNGEPQRRVAVAWASLYACMSTGRWCLNTDIKTLQRAMDLDYVLRMPSPRMLAVLEPAPPITCPYPNPCIALVENGDSA